MNKIQINFEFTDDTLKTFNGSDLRVFVNEWRWYEVWEGDRHLSIVNPDLIKVITIKTA